jgi:hypothetical protein
VFKTLVTARTVSQPAGMPPGLARINWYSRDGLLAPALWDSDGTPRPAAISFGVVAHAIGSEYVFDHVPETDPNLVRYVFRDSQDRPLLEYAWTTNDLDVTFTPPPGATYAVVTTYLNDPPVTYEGSFTLTIAPSTPIQVQWR